MEVRKVPSPRRGSFYGMPITNLAAPDGSWLEGEEFCYPSGARLRFAYATCEDGKRRKVRCGIPDTFFSIPGAVRIRGKYVRGFVTSNDAGGFVFKAYTPK